MAERFVTCELEDVIVGEPLPCSLYLFINFRFITYKLAGDALDRDSYERFELKKVNKLFILEQDAKAFDAWSERALKKLGPDPAAPAMPEGLRSARDDAHRKAMDIFQSAHPDQLVSQTIEVSRNLVTEVMRQPFAIQSLHQLQSFSQGTVDHSVNVSVLSVYLAMQMGYSHTLILQHIGMGALLHDVGKTRVVIHEGDSDSAIAEKMREHPELGAKLVSQNRQVPNEVTMVISQHHENYDGTGYPKKLHGTQIYDLARIVSIANHFDELVASASGGLIERQKAAVKKLDESDSHFDPQKLEKSLRILKLGV